MCVSSPAISSSAIPTGVVVVPGANIDAVYTRLAAVRDAEASYPTGPNGEVHVPEFVHTLLSSE